MLKKAKFIIPGLLLTFALNGFAAEMKVLGWDTPALQTRIDLIKNAKKEILVEYFEVAQDKLTLVGLGLLQEAARRGVKVKVIVDSMYADITRPQFAALMNTLNALGETKNFEIKVFNPRDSLNLPDQTYRNHDKLFVVDGEFAIIGGRNVTGSYFGRAADGKPNLRDVDVLTYGAEVAQNKTLKGRISLSPREYFMSLWNQNPMVKARELYEYSTERLNESCLAANPDQVDHCEALQRAAIQNVRKAQAEINQAVAVLNANQEPAQATRTWGLTARANSKEKLRAGMHQVEMLFMYNDPSQVMKNIDNKLVEQLGKVLLEKKPKTVSIVTPYLYPRPETLKLFDHLVNKYNTRFKIISNSLNSTDSTLVYAGYETIKPQLLALNTEIYEYNGPMNVQKQPTILHAKIMILDEDSESPTSLIGSFNMDQRSALINREIGVMIWGGQAKALTNDLLKEVDYIQRASTRSDGSEESNRRLMEMATPEKIKSLESDRGSFILKIKGLNKHI